MGVSAFEVVSATADTRALTRGALPGTSLTSRLTHRGVIFTHFFPKREDLHPFLKKGVSSPPEKGVIFRRHTSLTDPPPQLQIAYLDADEWLTNPSRLT